MLLFCQRRSAVAPVPRVTSRKIRFVHGGKLIEMCPFPCMAFFSIYHNFLRRNRKCRRRIQFNHSPQIENKKKPNIRHQEGKSNAVNLMTRRCLYFPHSTTICTFWELAFQTLSNRCRLETFEYIHDACICRLKQWFIKIVHSIVRVNVLSRVHKAITALIQAWKYDSAIEWPNWLKKNIRRCHRQSTENGTPFDNHWYSSISLICNESIFFAFPPEFRHNVNLCN